jgi:hypothetical protein
MIATLAEFAYAIRRDSAAAAKHQLLLELAEGLVVAEVGELATYPITAKAVVLEAAVRAYYSLLAVEEDDGDVDREAAQRLVYLTDEQIARLAGRAAAGPQFAFPGTWPYPDPVERDAEEVTS